MQNKTSQHILSTSANLLGFCLFVLTSIHFTNRAEKSIVDELTAVVALLLATSCVCSFVSLRSINSTSTKRWETVADFLFLAALIGILLIIVLIASGLIH